MFYVMIYLAKLLVLFMAFLVVVYIADAARLFFKGKKGVISRLIFVAVLAALLMGTPLLELLFIPADDLIDNSMASY